MCEDEKGIAEVLVRSVMNLYDEERVKIDCELSEESEDKVGKY